MAWAPHKLALTKKHLLHRIIEPREGESCTRIWGMTTDELLPRLPLFTFPPEFFFTWALSFFLPSFLSFFCFLGPYLRHMEVPRLGVESEQQLPAYATATLYLSRVCDLHYSSPQCWIPNPLSNTRDQTCILMDTSHIRFLCATKAAPPWALFLTPSNFIL